MQLHQQFTTISYRLQISAVNLYPPAFWILHFFSAYRNKRDTQGFETKCKKVRLNFSFQNMSIIALIVKETQNYCCLTITVKDTIPCFLRSKNRNMNTYDSCLLFSFFGLSIGLRNCSDLSREDKNSFKRRGKTEDL